jgi:hypothetical protein
VARDRNLDRVLEHGVAHSRNPDQSPEVGAIRDRRCESGVVHERNRGFHGYGLDVVGDCDLEQKR